MARRPDAAVDLRGHRGDLSRRRRRPGGEDDLLRPLPLRHRLQGRPPVLPRPEAGRPAAARPHRGHLRHVAADRGRTVAAPRLRRRHRGRPAGRRLLRVHGHRDRQRGHPAARAAGRREGPPREQHPGRLRGHLPGRHHRRGLVPLRAGAAPAAHRPAAASRRLGDRAVRAGRSRRPASARPTQAWVLRAFRVEGPHWAGRTVAQVEQAIPGARLFVQRLRQAREAGRSGSRASWSGPATRRGPAGPARACSSSRWPASAPRSRTRAARLPDGDPGRGGHRARMLPGRRWRSSPRCTAGAWCCAGSFARASRCPSSRARSVHRGDLLQLAGHERDVERAGQRPRLPGPHLARPPTCVFVGVGIVVGGLLGPPLGEGRRGGASPSPTSGGALVMGLVFGWLRSTRPAVGLHPRRPPSGSSTTSGSPAFIGAVGLTAGPSFVAGVRQTGFGLVAAGVVAAILPQAGRPRWSAARAEDRPGHPAGRLRRRRHLHRRR